MADTTQQSTEMADRQISLRMPQSISDRVERLRGVMAQQPEYRGFSISAAAVIRAVMEAGLYALEERYGIDSSAEITSPKKTTTTPKRKK
ncbi:MAG: hypothetical protein H5U40_07295 [Polyangiaceae bacterium]|nr:hypothetical protein [Polyangiaceae bacterium]